MERNLKSRLINQAVDAKAALEWTFLRKRYTRNVVLIVGMEKSGSTWLRNMFNALPGFHSFKPKHNSALDDTLRPGMFEPYRHRLAVIRLHTPWSEEATDILRQSNVPYIIQYRDLRDTAVSWYFYVTQVQSRHVLHDKISAMSFDEGLNYYIDRLLPERVRFIRNWRTHRDPQLSCEVTYEALLADTIAEFGRAARFCFGDIPDDVIVRAVKQNSFQSVTGRQPGEEDQSAFVRKGITGDWQNYFTPAHKERFKAVAGQFLVEIGYEKDLDW